MALKKNNIHFDPIDLHKKQEKREFAKNYLINECYLSKLDDVYSSYCQFWLDPQLQDKKKNKEEYKHINNLILFIQYPFWQLIYNMYRNDKLAKLHYEYFVKLTLFLLKNPNKIFDFKSDHHVFSVLMHVCFDIYFEYDQLKQVLYDFIEEYYKIKKIDDSNQKFKLKQIQEYLSILVPMRYELSIDNHFELIELTHKTKKKYKRTIKIYIEFLNENKEKKREERESYETKFKELFSINK